MKIVTVLGARPQFIKAATVSRAVAARTAVADVIVHTGQHYDANMSDIFFEELRIPKPAYHLGIGGGRHGQNTGRMIEAIEQVLLDEKPDWVLVYGDTDSTLAGAVATTKLHIPLAHVEAGLRSFNRAMPEEINRILTDHASDILFTPTTEATVQLGREGIADSMIHQVGDVMYDAALFHAGQSDAVAAMLQGYGLERGRYVLATIHRQENTDDANLLREIFLGLQEVARHLPVALPLHPRTRARLREQGLDDCTKGLNILEPVGYLEMTMLEQGAAVIVTDSGGVQKEAYFNQVPCVTLRTETEWNELVTLKWNRLVPPVSGHVVIAAAILAAQGAVGEQASPYGDGTAAEHIVKLLAG